MAKEKSVNRVEDVSKSKPKVGNKGKERKKRVVTGADSPDLVLQWLEMGDELFFDAEDFLELPDSVIEKMGTYDKRDYYIALGEHKRLGRLAAQADGPKIEVIGPVNDILERRKKHYNDDPRMHSTFQRVEDVTYLKELGYKVVKKGDGSNVVKTRDGKDDVVEMVVPKDVYGRHVQAVGNKSRERLGKSREQAKENIERLYPKGRRGKVVDESEGKLG